MVSCERELHSIVWHGRLQETPGLAEGTCNGSGRAPGRQPDSRSRPFVFRSQIIRSAMSVPANIVEGVGGGGWGASEQTPESSAASYGLRSTRQRSSSTTLIAARDLQVVRGSDSLTLISQVVEVRKMLYGLRRHLASRSKDTKQA
ncbi:MAG: four helix bundle protein [Gemmatimonadaceae bacterium]